MKHHQFEMKLPSNSLTTQIEAQVNEDVNDIKVQFRRVYGKECFYPLNELAEFFHQIAGGKCLTKNHIMLFKKKGYKVSIKHDLPELEEKS